MSSTGSGRHKKEEHEGPLGHLARNIKRHCNSMLMPERTGCRCQKVAAMQERGALENKVVEVQRAF